MRYLRGESSEDERDAMALRLAQDDSLFLALEELETEWIDRLARGELDPAEAEAARKHLRETGQEERLAIARAIARATGSPHACLVVAVAAWFITQSSRIEAPPERARNAATAPPELPALTIVLPALQTRDAGAASSPATAAPRQPLLLRLEIPEGRAFSQYRADWLGPNDTVLRSFPQEAASSSSQRFAEFRVAAGTIPAGSHDLALYGIAQGAEAVLLGYYTLVLAPPPETPAPVR
jgi:hypothetical protein